MATDYFSMMRDVVGSYGEGLDLARARRKSDAEEARRSQEFDWRKRDQERLSQAQQREDAAGATLDMVRSGVSPEQTEGIRQTYGLNPAQLSAASAGGFTGLQSKLASYDQPDSYDLQNAPAAPRISAAQLQQRPPSQLDTERALEGLAIAKRDTAGIRSSQDNQRILRMRDVHDQVAKISDADLPKFAAGVNTNGDLPLLYTGKSGKDGFTFMTTDPDGTPGKPFTATPTQVRQMVLSQKLGEAGFGPESMEIAGKAHSALNDLISKINKQTVDVAKGNNDATYHKGALRISEDRNAMARSGLGAKTRELDPATVEKLNTLSTQISEESDPKKRAVLEAQYRRDYAQAATKLGKVLQPQGERAPKPEFTPKDVGDEIQRLQGFREFSKTPYDVLRQKAIENLSGVQSRGLDDSVYGSAPKQAPAAAIQKPTAAARPVAQAPVYLPGDSDVAAQAVYEGRPVVAGQYGLPTPSKYRVTNDEVEAALAAQYGLK